MAIDLNSFADGTIVAKELLLEGAVDDGDWLTRD
jgi:hypothetical protein